MYTIYGSVLYPVTVGSAEGFLWGDDLAERPRKHRSFYTLKEALDTVDLDPRKGAKYVFSVATAMDERVNIAVYTDVLQIKVTGNKDILFYISLLDLEGS